MSDEMPDPRAYDEAFTERPAFAAEEPFVSDESRLIREVFALYELLERNAAYVVRTPEAEAERVEILRDIAELEALVA